jgi:hypothetical protein
LPAVLGYHYPLPHGIREVLAISVTNLQGVSFAEQDLYRWLSSRTPVAKIGYSIFISDLTGDADAHVQLAKLYLSYGPRHLVAPELQKAQRRVPVMRFALRKQIEGRMRNSGSSNNDTPEARRGLHVGGIVNLMGHSLT